MRVLSLLTLSLAACSFTTPVGDDTTNDGTLDDGVDLNADDDGDGLTNGEEADLGTDTTEADSDGDGYSDKDEVDTDHDPLDKTDVIYQGGWPYNPNKDAIDDPGFGGAKRAKVGGIMPNLITYDMFGDDFQTYDFAGHGKSVIVDTSAEWCYYCQEIAKYMKGKRSFFDDYEAQYPEFPTVRDMVANGDIYWVEIIDQNQDGATVALEDLEQWEKTYGFDNAPVIADEGQDMMTWMKGAGYPTLIMVDENMEITSFDSRDYTGVFTAAAELAP